MGKDKRPCAAFDVDALEDLHTRMHCAVATLWGMYDLMVGGTLGTPESYHNALAGAICHLDSLDGEMYGMVKEAIEAVRYE